MKKQLLLVPVILSFCLTALTQTTYKIDDSVKATGIYAEPVIISRTKNKQLHAVLRAGGAALYLRQQNGSQQFVLQLPKAATEIRQSPGTEKKGRKIYWNKNNSSKDNLFFYIVSAPDSAAGQTLYSAYIGWPQKKQWKLMGSYFLASASWMKTYTTSSKSNQRYSIHFNNHWLLRNTNSWKAMSGQSSATPSFRSFSNADSIVQQQQEETQLRSALNKDSVTYKEGVFFQVLKRGTGAAVQLTDTVVVHYKGYLFSNNEVFDQTKEKPAVFPLNRLIRGWQIAVPETQAGGKIRIWIPSGIAYGIRTFATAIPPNSVLVFDVEVMETKPQ